MGNLIFLVVALGLSVVGSVWLWFRHRPSTSVMSSIEGFREEMSALAADRPAPGSPPPARRSAGAGRRPGTVDRSGGAGGTVPRGTVRRRSDVPAPDHRVDPRDAGGMGAT